MTFRLKTLASAATGLALMVAPTMASAATPAANPATALSVAKTTRAGTPATAKSKLAEGPTATYVSIGILAALVVGVLLATGGSDDDSDSN